MRSSQLQITLTGAEASDLMVLKELLNKDGRKRSTSQTVAHAIRLAKEITQLKSTTS